MAVYSRYVNCRIILLVKSMAVKESPTNSTLGATAAIWDLLGSTKLTFAYKVVRI